MSPAKITRVELEECFRHECPVREHFFQEATRRTKLERAMERLKEENAAYQVTISYLLSQISELLNPNHAAMNLLRYSVEDLEKVRSVHFFMAGDVINIRIGISEEDFDTEMKVADALSMLFSTFAGLKFDFMMLPLNRVNIKEALPPNAKIVLSREVD